MDFADAPVIATQRLVLRGWQEADLVSFAWMNCDPAGVEFLPRALTRDDSDAMVGRIQDHFVEHGYGLWAVEIAETGEFAGFVGLSVTSFEADFTPAVEIGWRLAAEQGGQGYATEAARASVDYAFGKLRLDHLVSFTVPANVRSRAVMERIGMSHDSADDFDHPRLPESDHLRPHVLYRLGRSSSG